MVEQVRTFNLYFWKEKSIEVKMVKFVKANIVHHGHDRFNNTWQIPIISTNTS